MADLLRGPLRAPRGARRRAARAGSSRRSTTSTTASSPSRSARSAPAEDREALLSEARVLLAIPPHPHVPLVRDDFFDGDQYVIAMDWVEGTDLGRLLHARGPARARAVARAALAGRRRRRAHPPPRAAPAGRPRRREARQPRAHRERAGGARRLRAVVLADLDASPQPGPAASPRPSSSPAASPAGRATCTRSPPPRSPSSPATPPDRRAPVVGRHRPRAGRPARGGDPARPQHRPGQATGVGRRAGRAAARRVARVAAHRRAHVLPHRHRRLDVEVGDAARRHVTVARACTTTSSPPPPSGTAAGSSRRRARATRPSRCTRRPARR